MTLKVSLALSTVLICAAAFAQQPAATPAPAPAAEQPANGNQKLPTVRVRTDEVNVVFTVVDKSGKFVRDLKQDQFKVLDNHLPPRSVTSFAAQTDLPLQVGLLIDA